jgi:hypothetical protein
MRKPRKLMVVRETLRELDTPELRGPAGGSDAILTDLSNSEDPSCCRTNPFNRC